MAAWFNWEKILEEERRKQEIEDRSLQNAQKESEARKEEAQKKDLRTRTVEMNRRRAEEDDTYTPAGVSREAYNALRSGSYTSAQSEPTRRSAFSKDVATRKRAYEAVPKIKDIFGREQKATALDLMKRPEAVVQPTIRSSNASGYKALMEQSETRQRDLLNRINKATTNPVFDTDYIRNGSSQESISQLRKDYQTEVQYYNQLKQNRAKALIKENTSTPNYSAMQNPGSTWTKEDVEAKAFYDGMVQKVKDGSYTKEDYDDIVFLLNNTSGPMKTWVQKTFNEVPKFGFLSRVGEAVGGAVNRTIGNLENAFSAAWAKDVNSSAKRNQARKKWEADSGQTDGFYRPYRNSAGEWVNPPFEIMPRAGLLREWGDAANIAQYPNGVQSTTESLHTKRADESYQRGSYGLGSTGQFVYNAGSAIAGALTDAGAAALTGAPPNVTMALSAGGQAYQDALNEGKTTDEAFSYGAIWGGLVGAMNKVLGGMGITGANAKVPAWVHDSVKKVAQKPATSTAVKYIYNAMQEGGEEYLEEILEPVVRNIAFDENNEFQPFTQQALEAGLIGAISAGAINALEFPGNYRAARADAQNRTVTPANRASVGNASTAAQQRADTAVQNVWPTGVDEVQQQAQPETNDITHLSDKTDVAREYPVSEKLTHENITSHTPQMRKIMQEYEAATDPDIAAFAQYALANPNDNKTAIQLNDVTQRQAAEIERLTGINTEGYGTEAKANAFRHIEEGHGVNGTTDHSMADINDVARMQYVIDNYDLLELLPTESKEFRDRNQKPVPVVKLTKRVNGNYYVVEAVPDTNRRKLEIVSAYKEAAHQTRDAQGPRSDVRNASDVTAMDLIPTDSTVVDPVSTAPESSSSPNQTIPQTLLDVKSTADLEQARSVIGDYAKRGGIDIHWYSDQSRPDKADTNGFYENGAIYINENAENPYIEVFKHELFHSLADSDKQAVTEFFRRNVNENTQAFQDYKTRTMQANRRKNLRYSEADFWEEYTAQNAEFLLDEAWIERLAQSDRTLAQRILDWIRRAVQRIGDLFSAPKDYSAEVASHESGRVSGMSDTQLRQAQRLYEKALNGTREAGSGTRYSIETLPDGKRYVQADRQVITGNDPKQWAKQVERYINDEIRQGKDITVYGADGDPLTITRDTAGKAKFRNYITYPDGSKRRMDNQEYGVKLRAESHIDEVSAVSNRGNRIVPDTKKHNFAKDGFNYRTAYYRDTDGTYYRLTISVGKNGDINSVYNIGKLKEAPFPQVAQRPGEVNSSSEVGASNTTIPQSSTGVNNSIRESAQNDTTKSSLKRSKFYDSIQQADTVAEEVKQRAQESEADYYYRQIGNEETMKKAVAQVEQNVDAAGRRFSAIKGNATTDEIAQGFVLLKKYQDMGDYDAAADTAHKLSEIATKTGQQLQIYSILGRMTPEGMLRYAAKELETMKQRLAENPNRWGTWVKNNVDKLRLTAEDAKKITAYMERAQAMSDGRDKVIMFAEIQKLLQSKMPSTLGSKLSTLQRISLLLNPKTVITRNALSNMLINPVYAVRDFAASGMDKALSKKTGVRTLAAPNYKDQAKGWKKGAFESYDDFRRAINTRDVQANRYEIGNKLGSGPAFKGKNPLSKAIAFLDRTTGFLLDVGDRPFFEGYFLESLNGQLRANKTDTPTADMIDIATQTALEKTWQDDNVITRSASKMKNALNFGQDFGLGSMIVPFVKTPSNIAKAIVDFSPAGFAKAITVDAYNFTKAVKNGTVTAQMQNKFAKNIGNGIAGVLMYAAGLALAANGVTTGSDDEPDKDIRNFKRNILGVSPYSIKIGDEAFTYDWAQPVGSALSITADLNRNQINMDNAANVIANALVTGGNTLFEQSMLSGLSELFGGYDGFMLAVANAVLDLPSQFVPTLSKQAAELTDPYARRTATGSMTDKAANKVLARIPGASKTLEPVVDVLGRDVKRYGGKNNLFNVFLNPANVNIANPTAETKEIWRLYEETGDAGVFPKVAPNTFTYGGTSYSLTAKEQTQFQRVMGQETAKALQELFAGNSYDNPKSSKLYRKSTAKNKNDKTDEQMRADLVKEIIDEAYEAAKVDMLKRRGMVLKNKK